MANPSYVSGTNAEGAYPTLTISAPSGISSGDLLLAFVTVTLAGGGSTAAPPSGWTTIDSVGGGYGLIAAYYKIATGSEPGSYSWAFTGTSYACGAILLYSGAASTQPDVYASALGYSATWASSAVTTTATDDVLVAGVGNYYADAMGAPSGMTARESYYDTANIQSIATFDIDLTSPGSVGAYSGSISASAHWWSLTVAISPSAGGPSITGSTLAAASADALLEMSLVGDA